MIADTHQSTDEENKNRTVTILFGVDVRPYDSHTSSFEMFSPVDKNENITYSYIDNVKSQLIPIEIETMKHAGNEEKQRSLIFGSSKGECENSTAYQFPKSIIWLRDAKFGNEGIFDQPNGFVYRTPLDEVNMKQCGFIDSNCHRATETELKMKPQVQKWSSNMDKDKDKTEKTKATANLSISLKSGEIILSLQDMPPIKIKMDITELVRKLWRSHFKSKSNREVSRLLLSIKGTIAVTERTLTKNEQK